MAAVTMQHNSSIPFPELWSDELLSPESIFAQQMYIMAEWDRELNDDHLPQQPSSTDEPNIRPSPGHSNQVGSLSPDENGDAIFTPNSTIPDEADDVSFDPSSSDGELALVLSNSESNASPSSEYELVSRTPSNTSGFSAYDRPPPSPGVVSFVQRSRDESIPYRSAFPLAWPSFSVVSSHSRSSNQPHNHGPRSVSIDVDMEDDALNDIGLGPMGVLPDMVSFDDGTQQSPYAFIPSGANITFPSHEANLLASAPPYNAMSSFMPVYPPQSRSGVLPTIMYDPNTSTLSSYPYDEAQGYLQSQPHFHPQQAQQQFQQQYLLQREQQQQHQRQQQLQQQQQQQHRIHHEQQRQLLQQQEQHHRQFQQQLLLQSTPLSGQRALPSGESRLAISTTAQGMPLLGVHVQQDVSRNNPSKTRVYQTQPSSNASSPPKQPSPKNPRRIAVASRSDRASSGAPTIDNRLVKGGRKKNSHLNDETRIKSSKMRKIGACWLCAFQRDSCDDGHPCERCRMRIDKNQGFFVGCFRAKLPDFVMDFLPPSMTLMHQKQTIEDTVAKEVMFWDLQNPVEVYLTSGYGPPLKWKLYEFRPKTDDLLVQFQYLQDTNTGLTKRQEKYSPPLGIVKLVTSDDTYFLNYIDELMEEQHLADFPWDCFEEETQIDDFQARLLDLLCEFYKDTKPTQDSTHESIHRVLSMLIRMTIITHIMGHTLTILDKDLPDVLSSIRLTPLPAQPTRRTSPRLANRQFKFFFAVFRNQMYQRMLRWLQSTLHTSGHKAQTWLPALCAILGFAMVLEEVQRTIQIQADAKAFKREMTPAAAQAEAQNACERIDERYRLLVGLFQAKYKSATRGPSAEGSFGPGTPKLLDPVENKFCRSLRELLVEKADHLHSRRDITFSPENECKYTSRLVAKFLLPFLER